MKKTKKPDLILLISFLLLAVLGFIILAGVSITISQKNIGNSFHYLLHQIIYGFIPGGLLGFLAYKINLQSLKKISFPILIAILFFMGLIFIPKIGTFLGGAKRWISLGPISFQPSEFLKLIFIVYLAAWLTKHKQKGKKLLLVLLPLLVILGIISGLLIAQPDISTLAIISSITLIMYFCAGTPLYHSVLLALSGIATIGVLAISAPYRFRRLMVFFRPDLQPLGMGYQLKQSIIAIGSGVIFGKGLGLSVQKFGFLPQAMTDTIFSVFAEETGFIGATILILLFLIFAWQGFSVAKRSSDLFFKLMAIGITSWIIIQALVNIAAIMRILPLTGIPLPFISYGSSHLLVELIAIGILLNISKYAKT
ncbi:MAG: putative lipid II flippase FtsW [Patescibacteria group bacterium]|nr:putative lipid II flippase FtsW [Patescibacteria group bacterium]